jgi:speckle-type POZ protein
MSASTIVAKAASGSHVLKIDGYSRTTGFGVGKFFTSRSFQVGGRRWCLRYYPDGCDYNCNDWISILLCLDLSEAGEVRALYKISLLDQEGHPVASYVRESQTYITFTGMGEPRGFGHFITKAGLQNPLYLKDDAFSLRCDITVATGIVTEDVVIPAAEPDIKKEAELEVDRQCSRRLGAC